MKTHKYFITGTDTGIGKTYVSIGLISAFNKLGHTTIGMKPVSSGCFWKGATLYNNDALALQQISSVQLDYHMINPIAYEPAIAPHIAAKYNLNAAKVLLLSQPALTHPADVYIIEGIGGWNTPLNSHETMADFVKLANLEVILVVGLRLGCLNHAILTFNAIKNFGAPFKGWIANCIDPNMEEVQENINTLKYYIEAPCVGLVSYNGKISKLKLQACRVI